MARAPRDQTFTASDRIIDLLAAGAMGLGQALPATGQRVLARSLATAALGQAKARAQDNLGYVWPQMDTAARRQIARASVEAMLRGVMEIASAKGLMARARDWTPDGPGLSAFEAAQSAGQPVILATGHFGNWEAARAALTHRGHQIGGLYRPLNNGYLDRRWAAILSGLSGPVFPRGREGLRGFVKLLKSGGAGVILHDQFVADGDLLDFLGKPAATSLSAAELALRYNAELIPFYGIRRGVTAEFDVVLEAPVSAQTPASMMQALNDSLAARVTASPEQWLWPHRRWKPDRLARMGRDVNPAGPPP
ncbi:MAG: lauroyl acyltransferase [Pseudomonadota bacterium]